MKSMWSCVRKDWLRCRKIYLKFIFESKINLIFWGNPGGESRNDEYYLLGE